jgi:hypothetical protein
MTTPASVAGVVPPDSDICAAATDLARHLSEPFLFNHVMRTYFFAALAGQAAGARVDSEMLFLGCTLHDLGLTSAAPSDARFEVDGADMASEFLARHGFSDDRIAVVWEAIALHTTAAIPQRKQPEIALVQSGAAIDVGAIPLGILPSDAVAEVLARWPRLGFKREMVASLARQVDRHPAAAGSPVVADAGERLIDGFERVNLCDVIAAAAFED